MKVLVISDIHSNIEALQIAMDEKFDEVICIGDIVDYGPNPKECINLIRSSNPLIMIKGNHDHAAAFDVSCGCAPQYQEMSEQTRAYGRSLLNEEYFDFLGNHDLIKTIEIDGFKILTVHASPRSEKEYMYKYFTPELSDNAFKKVIGDVNADILIVGHSHYPFVKKIDNLTVINPGSIGQPRIGGPKTSFAIIDNGETQLIRKEYDNYMTIRKISDMTVSESVKKDLVALLK